MISYGAVTVVNAIPCGIGAAVGVNLRTQADFRVHGSEKNVTILNDPNESTEMARICVRNTFRHFRTEEPEGWSLSVDSEIPISRGLKSSSSACNSVISTVAEWICKEYGIPGFSDDTEGTLDMIRLGVRSATDAGVTVTGAFDDACACHLGGLVITDNKDNILMHHAPADGNDVILLIPDKKIRKSSLDRQAFAALSENMKELAVLARTDWYSALTKNGKLVAKAVGACDDIAGRAMAMGASAAGMSGTGPAISVIVNKGDGMSFLRDLGHEGYDAMVTRTR